MKIRLSILSVIFLFLFSACSNKKVEYVYNIKEYSQEEIDIAMDNVIQNFNRYIWRKVKSVNL